MKQLALLTTMAFLCSLDIYSQDYHFKPSFGAILDSTQTKSLMRQCSRTSYPKVKNYWNPTPNDIEQLENNFKKLYMDTLKTYYRFGKNIDSLQHSGFQYVGIIIDRKKYIYINAFPLSLMKFYKEHKELNKDFYKSPVVMCDGGPRFWGALFDIETQQFSDLSFNGNA